RGGLAETSPPAQVFAGLLQSLHTTCAAGGSGLRSRFSDGSQRQRGGARVTLMPGTPFVTGDWGTSHLRLFLCDEAGKVLDTVTGSGAAAGDFANVFDSLVARWQTRRPQPPTVLSGMVGSSIGWIQAPYLACPARPEEIA